MCAHWVGMVAFSSGGAEGGVLFPRTPIRTLVILGEQPCECWRSGKVIISLRGRAHGKVRVSTARTTLKKYCDSNIKAI